MKISANYESTVRLSRMPIVKELGMPSYWVREGEFHGEDAPDVRSMEAVLNRENTLILAHAMLSPEMRALQPTFPHFEADQDQEGSGFFHTEVTGSAAYIAALAATVEALGAKRGTYKLPLSNRPIREFATRSVALQASARAKTR